MSASETIKSTFWSSMDREVGTIHSQKRVGENGSDEYSMYGLAGDTASEVQGALVAIFSGVARGSSKAQVIELVKNIEKTAQVSGGKSLQNAMASLIVVAFQLRDCRGGKGEKQLSRWILMYIYEKYPKTINALVPLFPEYGYWKDLSYFIEDSHGNRKFNSLVNTCYEVMVSQLKEDWMTIQDYDKVESGQSGKANKPKLSLLAKYIPKEGRSFDKKCKCSKRLAKLLFPEEFEGNCYRAMKQFRQMVPRLNKEINTTEVLMSDNRFDEINFNLVPGRCLNMNRRAFLNIKGGKKCKTQEQRSYEPQRIDCCDNLKNHMELAKTGKAKIHGKQMFIHELARTYFPVGYSDVFESNTTQDEDTLIQLQWDNIKQGLQDKIKEEGLDINRGLSLIDVSGSMTGTPMEVAVSLGIMVSELQDTIYGNRFISFAETPKWIEFNKDWTLKEKVQHTLKSQWGYSTDFLAAHDLILSIAVKEKLTPDQLPSWFIVVSDMQFNQASINTGSNVYSTLDQFADKTLLNSVRNKSASTNNWGGSCSIKTSDFQTIHEILVETYKKIGLAVCGKPYELPKTIYWNVRGDTVGFPVQADTPNTMMISGWSSDLLPLVLENKLDAYVEKAKPTSWDLFVKAMSQERYDTILGIIENTNETVFKGFKAPVRNEDDSLSLETQTQTQSNVDTEQKKEWTSTQLKDWVKSTINSNSNISSKFMENQIDGMMFDIIASSIDHEILIDCGVSSKIQRLKLFSEWCKM